MVQDTRGLCASIIVPATGSADRLADTVESILIQSCPDLELIIVNNGSSAAVPEILAAYPDPRIVHLRLPGPSGTALAWNAGVGAARGGLVGFAGSGDTWERRRLEEQAGAFLRLDPDFGVVYSDRWVITSAGNRAYWHMPDMEGSGLLDPYATGYLAEPLGTGPILVRRPFLERAGPFDEELRTFSATDLIIRLQRLCRFHHIGKPLYSCRSCSDDPGDPFGDSIARLLLLRKYPDALANPLFLAHQAEHIRRSLMTVPSSNPRDPDRSPRETESTRSRHPVPYY